MELDHRSRPIVRQPDKGDRDVDASTSDTEDADGDRPNMTRAGVRGDPVTNYRPRRRGRPGKVPRRTILRHGQDAVNSVFDSD